MTFMELAQNRYSERFFDPRPVEDEKLRQILEAVLGIRIGDDVIGSAAERYQQKMAVIRGGYV